MRKTLCSCFVAVDGTITLRREIAPEAAKAVTSCLRSHGLLERSADVPSVERVICAIVGSNDEIAVPISIPASLVANRICSAIRGQQLAA